MQATHVGQSCVLNQTAFHQTHTQRVGGHRPTSDPHPSVVGMHPRRHIQTDQPTRLTTLAFFKQQSQCFR